MSAYNYLAEVDTEKEIPTDDRKHKVCSAIDKLHKAMETIQGRFRLGSGHHTYPPFSEMFVHPASSFFLDKVANVGTILTENCLSLGKSLAWGYVGIVLCVEDLGAYTKSKSLYESNEFWVDYFTGISKDLCHDIENDIFTFIVIEKKSNKNGYKMKYQLSDEVIQLLKQNATIKARKYKVIVCQDSLNSQEAFTIDELWIPPPYNISINSNHCVQRCYAPRLNGNFENVDISSMCAEKCAEIIDLQEKLQIRFTELKDCVKF